jgi:hypothetical protein
MRRERCDVVPASVLQNIRECADTALVSLMFCKNIQKKVLDDLYAKKKTPATFL